MECLFDYDENNQDEKEAMEEAVPEVMARKRCARTHTRAHTWRVSLHPQTHSLTCMCPLMPIQAKARNKSFKAIHHRCSYAGGSGCISPLSGFLIDSNYKSTSMPSPTLCPMPSNSSPAIQEFGS